MKKKQWGKRILSVILCLALALPMTTAGVPEVSAEESEDVYVNTNTGETFYAPWFITGYDEVLVYDGTEKIPPIGVKDRNGKKLQEGVDYEIIDVKGDTVNAGLHEYTKNNYVEVTLKSIGFDKECTWTVQYGIQQANLSDYKFSRVFDFETYEFHVVGTSTLDGKTVLPEEDYIIDGNQVVPSETGNCYGSADFLTDNEVTSELEYRTVTWDGSEKEPKLNLYVDGQPLTEGENYTVEYKNNKDIGTAYVKWTCSGGLEGREEFYILPRSIPDEGTVTLDYDSVAYDGTAKEPSVKVVWGGNTLKKGTDYSVSYYNNTDIGTARVVVTGKGIYNGTTEKTFTIDQIDLSSGGAAKLEYESVDYDGTAKEPSVTVTCDGKLLTEGTDYTLEYSNNVNVGTAQVLVTGKGNYTGAVTRTFAISDTELKNIAVCQFSDLSSRTYTGEDFFPKMIVKDGAKVLLQDTDYTLTYSGNRDAGTASVYVIGIGDYTGSVTRTFAIKKASQSISYTKTYNEVYSSKAFTVDARRTSGEGSLSYESSDQDVATVNGDGKVTIKGTGAATITVTAKEMSNYKEKSVKITITVSPNRQTVKSLATAKGRKLTVKWKKDTRATGYQIQYSTNKNFSGAKTVTIGKNTTTLKTLTKLTKGKRYYVRVRSYKAAKVNGTTKKLYGAWSNAKRSGSIKK